MSIWYMSGRTFQTKLIKSEDPESLLNARYVLVSSRIRTTMKYRKNVINAGTRLFPSNRLLADIGLYSENFFEREYIKQLKENRGFLASIVYNAVIKNRTFIFLCSEVEWELAYGEPKPKKFLKILAEYIYDEFGYPIYNYTKYKNGKEVKISYNKNEVLKRCRKILKADRNQYLNKKLRTAKGRRELLKEMSGSEMKALLENCDIYTKGMSKKEMKSTIKNYLFD